MKQLGNLTNLVHHTNLSLEGVGWFLVSIYLNTY
jgi:hypothetical protein